MTLVPLLFSDWWQDLERPHYLLDQNFGLGLSPEQLIPSNAYDQYYSPSLYGRRRNPLTYYRPWGELMRQMEGGGTSTIKNDKDKFEVILDVQQFKPNEITVKVVDKFVVVEGEHKEQKDQHGTVSRQFVRKYMIPEQCNIDQVTSTLSSDGVLSIIAPRKEEALPSNQKIINIQHTGKPAVQAKKESAENKVDKKP
ncbi:PREDICTED: protein lethal(2)essential for life-like [Ceratosolen solmsi marchali]|uniref:Protein lethal(2)essential for life-like n=1 Tax=Ceratosolen solmsi marchali TaxID=326594 RepID=A0AAJ6YLZ6_9HYME|nr:PREDICTED: protein lethal(2)essential for life-like [Ceratosolen solmsi marchali]